MDIDNSEREEIARQVLEERDRLSEAVKNHDYTEVNNVIENLDTLADEVRGKVREEEITAREINGVLFCYVDGQIEIGHETGHDKPYLFHPNDIKEAIEFFRACGADV